MKICSKCKIEKELTEFCVNKSRKDGLSYRCKICRGNDNKEYYKNNKSLHKIKTKQYRDNNKEKIKQWREVNPGYMNQYFKQRKQTDPLFRLSCNLRSLISMSLQNKGHRKNTKTENILGCTFEEFKQHLESQFEPWMNWENQGLYNGEMNYGWDIDHIIPISSGQTEEEIIKLNHYTNLQPLCSKINRDIKKDKTNYY